MLCAHCGTSNLEEEKICCSCGAVLEQQPVFSYQPIFKPLTEKVDASPPSSADLAYQSEAVVERTPETVFPMKKKHGTALVVLASILLAVTILCIVGFIFRNQIIKMVMPEQYLQMSITRTVAQSQMGAGRLLDFGKFSNSAVNNEFSYEQEEGDSVFSMAGSIMYDKASEKSLTNVSFGVDGTDYEDYIYYFSQDQIVISVPTDTTEPDLLTIDPATFNEEWNKKGYDEIAELQDLPELIDSLFGKSGEGETGSESDVNANFIKSFTDKAVFSTGGTVKKEIGGVERTLDVMTYTVSKSDANEGYQDYISGMEEQMSAATESYMGYKDSLFEMYESLEITSDIELSFYINQDGYVNQVEISKIEIENDGDSVEIDMGIDIWNEAETTYTSSEITISSEGDKAAFGIESEGSFVDGVYTYKADIGPKEDGSFSDSNISISLEWKTKDTTGENVSLEIDQDDDDGYEMSITGNLTEDKEKISLSDATIEVTGASESIFTADFSYSISKISASEVTIDTSDSTPLLSYKPFKEYMEELLSYHE